jgi:ankyrin repeat protein
MIAAMSDRSRDIVKLLIAKGADIRVVDKADDTMLHAAAIGNDTDTIWLFIDAGLDVNAAEASGFTPLMLSAQHHNLAAVKRLLAKGARVNAVSAMGEIQSHGVTRVKNGVIALGHFTPLLLAAPGGPTDLVATLLDAGADVNVKDVRGMTPLMLASASDHTSPDVVRLLLSKGADIQVKSPEGETALDWALKSGSTPIAALLKTVGAIASPARVADAASPAPVALRPAVERGLALLEKTSADYFAKGGCPACHAQQITEVVARVARTKGLRLDPDEAVNRQKVVKGRYASLAPGLMQRIDVPGTPVVPIYSLWALASAGTPPDSTTDAMAINVAAQQLADGRWHIGGVPRPPIGDGDITTTALAVRVLKAYAPPARADMTARLDTAVAWLRTTPTVTADDRNMQLLGLAWSGADQKPLRTLGDAIIATQRADGGWAQRGELDSDPYATGQTLFALSSAIGVAASDAAYQRGVKFLLSTQRADGSWYVRSRAVKFQPFFESGFPYGHDQWISSMATGWATAALAHAVSDRPATQVAR